MFEERKPPIAGKLILKAKCKYHEDLTTLMPKLLRRHRYNAKKVAMAMGVNHNAILHWLTTNQYRFDRKTRRWTK